MRWESLFLEEGEAAGENGEPGGPQKKRKMAGAGGGGAKTGPGKEDAGLDCWRPGYPCWNQPGHPKAFERAAWKAREDGTASILGTVTIRSTSIMADSGQCRSISGVLVQGRGLWVLSKVRVLGGWGAMAGILWGRERVGRGMAGHKYSLRFAFIGGGGGSGVSDGVGVCVRRRTGPYTWW